MCADGLRLHVTIQNRAQSPQHFQLLVANGIRIAARRWLHRKNADKLQKMALDHVAQGAGLVVELTTTFNAQLLGHGDLHVPYASTSPKWLKQGISETQRDQVLDRLLAQVVVDAIDLVLAEDRSNTAVDGIRGPAVLAQRLFQHYAGTWA